VSVRSITGSSAVFKNSASSPAAARSSRMSRTVAASGYVRPLLATPEAGDQRGQEPQ
jgi:hypothetical protein